MELVYKLIQNLFLYFVIVVGQNSDRMRNDAVVLSSVYDAMRNNFVDDAGAHSIRNNLLNYELRNKRNINARWDLDDGHRDEQASYVPHPQPYSKEGYRNPDSDTGDDSVPSGNELICSVYNGKQNHHQDERFYGQNPFLDHNNWKVFGGVGYFMGKAVKFVLSGIALVSLPIIFLVAVGIPLKILLSLKAMTVTNSIVFGSLIYRLLNRFLMRPPPPAMPVPDNNDMDNNNNNNNNNNINNALRNELLYDKVGTSLESNVDYTDYNEEKLQKIIESIKNKNKDW